MFRKLQDLDNVYSVSFVPIEEIFGGDTNTSPVEDDASDKNIEIGLIVGISVLAVLLLLVSGGAFLLWWFMIRPYEFKDRHTSETNLKDDFDEQNHSDPVVTSDFIDSDRGVPLSHSTGYDVESGGKQ